MIICSALKIEYNEKEYIICGLRHSDCYETLYKLNSEAYKKGKIEEGFITNLNQFLDRYEACGHAYGCGQISERTSQDKMANNEKVLYSEDLY